MTEDLLEEMDGDMEDDSLDRAETKSKKSFVKRLLGSKKRLFLILLIAVFLVSTFLGVWFFFLRGSPEEASLSNGRSATEEKAPGESDQIAEIVFEDIIELEPFERIRLKTNSAMGLVSLNISLELSDHRYRKQVYSMEDRIRKIIIGQVREMRWLELRNPEGKIHLKYELLKRLNSIFPKVMVRNIYFTNLIMQ
ncbi:MAG: flagellar basal body-associated protein [Desulfobacteraceae bacterium]|nr:flagellar basal body-associated protein [Desulfobacteraceae bacterium]